MIGVTMAIWDGQYKSTGKHACYGSDEEEEIRDAREVARKLDIPYHVFNCSAEYKQAVLEELGRLDANNTLTPEQRQAARRAMSAETERAVQGVLGEKAYRAYLRSGQGAWIQGAPAP